MGPSHMQVTQAKTSMATMGASSRPSTWRARGWARLWVGVGVGRACARARGALEWGGRHRQVSLGAIRGPVVIFGCELSRGRARLVLAPEVRDGAAPAGLGDERVRRACSAGLAGESGAR